MEDTVQNSTSIPEPMQPTTPEIQTPVTQPVPSIPSNSSSKTRYILLAVLIFLILIIIGGGTYYLGVVKQSTSQKNNNLTKTTTSLSPTTVPIPTTSSTVNNQVIVKQVIIKTGIDFSVPTQNPLYILKTAKGHYLIAIDSNPTPKLIYDGQIINANNFMNEPNGIALSSNGLHYAYITQENNTSTLYIDNQKIKTSPEILVIDAVTNDGNSYFYDSGKQSTGAGQETLMENDKLLYTAPQGFIDCWVSSDGTHYLAELRNFTNNNFNPILVYDGNQIYKGGELGEIQLSPNGKHYGYVIPGVPGGSQTAVVDGDVKLKSDSIPFLRVTDLGHYAISSYQADGKPQVEIDANMIAIDTSTPNPALVAINNDASHYVINDGNWKLDNKPIQLGNGPTVANLLNGVDNVEFDGNTLYVYILTK